MKVLLKYLFSFVLLSAAALLPACTNSTDDGSYVEPISLYEKIGGKWTLTAVAQIDETAKVSNITPNEISLLGQFGFKDFAISFDVDGDNQPTSYNVSGTAPELFPAKGYWDLESPFQLADGSVPVINLYSDAARTTLTGRLAVMSVPGAAPTMTLNLTRSAAGIPFVTYQYKLTNATSAK